jgi:mono/diheme cytochrome c family protein
MKMATIRMTAILVLTGVLGGVGTVATAQDDDSILSVDPSLLRPEQPEMALPELDAERGRKLFVVKGCVVCHSVNNVGGQAIRNLGGEPATSLDSSKMPLRMDPFEFFARMWDGAPEMIALQKEGLGYQIKLKSDEMADIMAFLFSETEQARFTDDSFIPPIFWYRDKADSVEQ